MYCIFLLITYYLIQSLNESQYVVVISFICCFQESLKFRLLGSDGDIGSWGHEYVRLESANFILGDVYPSTEFVRCDISIYSYC